MARKKIIAGNWKMNMTPTEAVALVNELKPLVANDEVDVVFCVPAIDIIPAMEAAKGSNIHIGAENMYFGISGKPCIHVEGIALGQFQASSQRKVTPPLLGNIV